METLIISGKNIQSQIIALDKILSTLGNSMDFDHYIPEIPGMGVSATKDIKGIKFSTIDSSKKVTKGPWNKYLLSSEILKIGDISLVYLPKGLSFKGEKNNSWSLNDLPRNPIDSQFPEKLLDFLLNGIGVQEGALFYRKDKMLHSLASKGINVRNQAESLLLQYVDRNSNNVIHVNFETHTILFNAGLSPHNFVIVKSDISNDMEAVLYLPWPNEESKLNTNILETIIHLCAQSISFHLFHMFNRSIEKEVSSFSKGQFYWGNTSSMQRLKTLTDRLAPTDLSLLVNGETGSGKDVLANYIAARSERSKLIAINCAAIPRELAESVLFGHTKGSFTGAVKDSIGKITEADGGTLFLDEIAELDPEVQSKLLRVLQDGIVTPIGGMPIKVSVRVIAATHKDLPNMVRDGLFREDLYFRLNEATLTLPPLRERQGDIQTLAKVFLDEVCNDNNLEQKVFSSSGLDFLKAYPWYGNIRELLSTMRRTAILVDSPIVEAFDLESNTQTSLTQTNSNEFPLNLSEAKDVLVNMQVKKALKESNGNKTQAAKLLGVTSRTLFRMIADHDISDIDNDMHVTPTNVTNRNHIQKSGTTSAYIGSKK